jgi:hypothetical protein
MTGCLAIKGVNANSPARQIKKQGTCVLMLALYMDHHVPSAITMGLRRRGVDVLTADEDGSAALEAAPLLERATVLGRVLFSKTMICSRSPTNGWCYTATSRV